MKIIGSGAGILATIGEPMATALPKMLQHPYAVASRVVGKSCVLIKYEVLNEIIMPMLVMKISAVNTKLSTISP